MGRILFYILIGLAIYWLWRGLTRPKARPPEADARHPQGESMVTCARCGVNLPKSDARAEADRWVCLANPNCR